MDLNSAFDAIQTRNGLIALGIFLVFLLVVLAAVCIFGLEITFKPFSIRRREKQNNKNQLNGNSQSIENLDIDFLVQIIKDAYSLHKAQLDDIQDEYKCKIDTSNKKCISDLMNSIMLEYMDVLNKNSKSLDNDQHDILELYLEKDVNDVILNSLRSFYDDDMTQTEADQTIENSINSIIIDLKTRLLRYRLIKDQSSLRAVYDDSPRFIANSLRDAFKNYINYAKEEREEIDNLIEKHNIALEEKIRTYVQSGGQPKDNNGNGNGNSNDS